MLTLDYAFSASISRSELEDYVRNVEVTIRCPDREGLESYVIGKLALDQILWADAIHDGEQLFDVCDNDSGGLHSVHVVLTRGTNELRKDLAIEEYVGHVLFLWAAVFHPSIHPYRQAIIHTVCSLFGEDSLAVMWSDVTGLSAAELAELGFCKIAGAELIFRHNALRCSFGDEHPRGMDADGAEGSPESEEWVLREWKKFE